MHPTEIPLASGNWSLAQPCAISEIHRERKAQGHSGAPELAKIQVMGFTLVVIGIYLATVIHQIVSNPVITSLPNIDASLLVLMGISQEATWARNW